MIQATTLQKSQVVFLNVDLFFDQSILVFHRHIDICRYLSICVDICRFVSISVDMCRYLSRWNTSHAGKDTHLLLTQKICSFFSSSVSLLLKYAKAGPTCWSFYSVFIYIFTVCSAVTTVRMPNSHVHASNCCICVLFFFFIFLVFNDKSLWSKLQNTKPQLRVFVIKYLIRTSSVS